MPDPTPPHRPSFPDDPNSTETLRTQDLARRRALIDSPPNAIGPYKILETIGEGGMGVVYLAEQTKPIHRRVALKLIKLGMDTKLVIARFEAEREALALMNHPHVAKVFDAGATEQGRPYFVMEYVEGEALTRYCDRNRIPTKDRLKLFMQVCHAVQHAHQKGIIHRDLKPSNVLVTKVDNAPAVKVIDFGIAKATQQRVAEATFFTEQGQLVGTPAYMSPEQADPTTQDIDTRTDVYSLGVILYELLVGALPFEPRTLRSAALMEIVRIIREVDPPKPSTRLGSLASEPRALARAETGQPDSARTEVRGSSIDEIARQRQTDPASLVKQLRGDLDWIVMKCLEKDRARRYDTANDLAMDITRHLGDEPVVASPPSRGYRMHKFVRRNRGAVTGAAIVVAVLILGVVGTTWGFVRAVVAQRNAVQRAEESEAVTQFLSDMLAAVDPAESGKDVSVREILDKSSKTIGERFTNQPLVEARLRSTIGKSYFELGVYPEAEQHLPQAFEMYRSLRGEDHLETIRSMNALAYLYFQQGRNDEAWALNEKTVTQALRVLGEENTQSLTALRLKGAIMGQTGRWEGLLPLQENNLKLLRRIKGEENLDTLKAMHNLANLYFNRGRTNEAVSLYEQRIAISRRVFGEDHSTALMTMRMLAHAYADMGRTDEALTLKERVLATARRVFGEEHLQTLMDMTYLASFYAELDRFAEARALFEEALVTDRRVFGEQGVDTAEALRLYAWILLTTGPEERRQENAQEALGFAERAAAIFENTNPRSPWSRLITLARAQHMTGATEKAIQTQERAFALLPEGHVLRWECEGGLATYYRSVGRVADADRMDRLRLDGLRRLIEGGEESLQVLNDYARDLLTIAAPDLRDPAAALPLAERACALADERETYGRWNYLDTLALAQHRTGDTAKAIETQRRALELIPPEYHQQRKEMQESLAEYEAALATSAPSAP